MPPACYSLFGEKKKSFCGWFVIIKSSDAYASNVSQCIGNNDSNISSMKSYDSHVMMQHLLTMVICGYLSGDVQAALIELECSFENCVAKKLKI